MDCTVIRAAARGGSSSPPNSRSAHIVEEEVDEYCRDIDLTEESRAAGQYLTWRNLTSDEKRAIVSRSLCVGSTSAVEERVG